MSAGPPRTTWVIATHNDGKLAEFRSLLRDLPLALRSAAELRLPEPSETGTTFETNANLKATAAMKATGITTLADDSGVVVPALGGEPGIHTARWAGPGRDFAVARQRVHDRLAEIGHCTDHRAIYVSVLSLASPTGRVNTFRGETHGVLVWPIRGEFESGFEPMFMPDGYAVTYGEMSSAQRSRANARAQAMRQLLAFVSGDI